LKNACKNLDCRMKKARRYLVSFIDKNGNKIKITLSGAELETIYQTAAINQVKLSEQIQIYLGGK
jgi:plasmid rolling circle replication initiator protein Rep